MTPCPRSKGREIGEGFTCAYQGRTIPCCSPGEKAWQRILLLADLGGVEMTPRGLCLQGWVSCVLQRKRLVIPVEIARGWTGRNEHAGCSGSEPWSGRVPMWKFSPHGPLLFSPSCWWVGEGCSNCTLPSLQVTHSFAPMYHYTFEIVYLS